MQFAQWVPRSAFAVLEADASIRWRLRESPAFDPTAATGPFTTLVAFLPRAFAAEVAECLLALPALAGHYRYPATQLHVTVRNLDGADLTLLPELLQGLSKVRLSVDRLGFTRETLLLRLFASSALMRLRVALDDLPGVGPQPWALRGLAFSNVLRLNGPVSRDLRRSVRTLRGQLVGRTLELEHLTLMRTDKVGNPHRSQVLASYPLVEGPQR